MSKETISELFEVKPGKKVRLKDSEASRLEKKLFATSDKKEAKKEPTHKSIKEKRAAKNAKKAAK